jgi:CBS-domain-containing membrane protein
MKNLVIIAALLFGFNLIAQNPQLDKREHKKEMHQKMSDLTPEQVAAIRTKQMTLHLDLTESQQLQIEKMELERAKKRKEKMATRKKRSELTADEIAANKMDMLDDKIATKKMLKSILNEDQFQKWEKSAHKKGEHKKGNHFKKEGSPNNN